MATPSYIRLAQLTEAMQQVIEDSLGGYQVWVVAEVTSHTYRAGSQHHYFDLVEKDRHTSTIVARLQARAWKEGAVQIAAFEQSTGQRFGNDIQVLVRVTISFHPAYGLQLVLLDIDTSYTLGALEKQKQDTLLRLVRDNPEHVAYDGETYTTYNQRHLLPKVIKRIAVISSSTSAGLEDFQHTLAYNTYGYAIATDMYYALMQGENNARHLVDQLVAIYQSGMTYDLVIIIRGGGAQTDFLLFEQYAIGRAIARFPVPVLTGIGHQKNETIADLMAHTAVKTPTKAAEFIIAHNRSFEEELLAAERLIVIRSQQLLADARQALMRAADNLSRSAGGFLNTRKQELQEQLRVVTQAPHQQLHQQRTRLNYALLKTGLQAKVLLQSRWFGLKLHRQRLQWVSNAYLQRQQAALMAQQKATQLMQPANVLKKGFALMQDANGSTMEADDLQAQQQINIILAGYRLEATITQKTPHEGQELNL